MDASRETLISELQSIVSELGHVPLPEELDEYSSHGLGAYMDAFGSWHNAITSAGFEQPMGRRIPDNELLAELRRVGEELEKTPSEGDMTEHGGYGAATYRNRFDSWSNAVAAAGFDPHKSRKERSREELISELQRLADSLDRSPSYTDMEDQGNYAPETYNNEFGSWNEALDAAGLERRRVQKQSLDELTTELQRLSDQLERPPRSIDIEEHSDYSVGVFYNRFGSWESALEAAGIDPPQSPPREKLIEELQTIAAETDGRPTVDRVNEMGTYSIYQYRKEFGSWGEAVEAAGFESREPSRQIPTEKLLDELQFLADDLGRTPRMDDMQKDGSFSPTTYYNRFGSWSTAIEAAGLSEMD
ncbi:HNH family endonuclease [Halalkaliarchaeum desulfuricum]|uniref:HNH family endonuclease n=2 Tax=Halalkaliarchaeum desulfuricum TaxID=2055893 RepID=A0A343TGS7_9EURY|nr:HNH family endonuclease [Halalkaliarchaeum desulfuricum]